MPTHRFLILLRGINVGGNNIIKMADLRESFEDMGFTDVVTYIQSGNLICTSGKSADATASAIEKGLAKRFGYKNPLFLVTKKQLEDAVKGAPKGFGKEPKKYRYDVMFLHSKLPAKKALEQIKTREGVDNTTAGKGVIYFSRLIAKVMSSYISKISTLPIYKDMTIRNWNTTTKLLEMMED